MKKTDIPEVVIDYCIDNRVTIEVGICQMIEEKLKVVDTGLKALNQEVVDKMNAVTKPAEVTDYDMKNVQAFLDFLHSHNKDNDE